MTTLPSKCFVNKALFDIDYKMSYHREYANECRQFWITIFTNPREYGPIDRTMLTCRFENIILKRHREALAGKPIQIESKLEAENKRSFITTRTGRHWNEEAPATPIEEEQAVDEIWNYVLYANMTKLALSSPHLKGKKRKRPR